jgi:hypothetical protein
MATTLSKAETTGELSDLRDLLVEERKRVDHLLQRVEKALQNGKRRRAQADDEPQPSEAVPAPRPSPLDKIKGVVAATTDLRVSNGNISAERVAKLYGVSLSQLAKWLDRSRQTVSKTPDADSLQNALSYFERVARLRMITKGDAEFRKWLRTPHDLLDNAPPLELMAKGEWQALVDYVEDILTGSPG